MIFSLFALAQTALSSNEAKIDDFSPQLRIGFVETKDLHFDQEDILVDIDGITYLVHSLTKAGNIWLAEVIAAEKCAWGHPLCNYCGLCHHRICPLYQSRCSKSK